MKKKSFLSSLIIAVVCGTLIMSFYTRVAASSTLSGEDCTMTDPSVSNFENFAPPSSKVDCGKCENDGAAYNVTIGGISFKRQPRKSVANEVQLNTCKAKASATCVPTVANPNYEKDPCNDILTVNTNNTNTN